MVYSYPRILSDRKLRIDLHSDTEDLINIIQSNKQTNKQPLITKARPDTTGFHLYELSRIRKPTGTKSTLVVAKAVCRRQRVLANEHEVSF